MTYYHGGIPGLKPGDLITPHTPNVVDGCAICAAKAAGQQPHVPGLGVIEPSAEDHFPTWTVPAAHVRHVYDRYVQLTPGQRRSLWRRWTTADIAALTT